MQLKLEFYDYKNDKIPLKYCDIFLILAHNNDCGHTLEPPHCIGSNEYPQSIFRAKIREIMYSHVNPSFTIYKWDGRGSTDDPHKVDAGKGVMFFFYV